MRSQIRLHSDFTEYHIIRLPLELSNMFFEYVFDKENKKWL